MDSTAEVMDHPPGDVPSDDDDDDDDCKWNAASSAASSAATKSASVMGRRSLLHQTTAPAFSPDAPPPFFWTVTIWPLIARCDDPPDRFSFPPAGSAAAAAGDVEVG